mgnify:CR=1 FL=1
MHIKAFCGYFCATVHVAANGANLERTGKIGRAHVRTPGALCRKNAATVIMNGRYYVPVAAVS